MTFHIIIKGRNTYGKTRSEQELNLRKDGKRGMTGAQLEKMQWYEKKYGVKEHILSHEVVLEKRPKIRDPQEIRDLKQTKRKTESDND